MVHCIQPWCFFKGIRLVVEKGREESCDCQQVPLSRWQCGGWGQPGQGGALGSPGAPEGGAFVRNPRWEPTAHAGAKLVLARWSSLVEHLVLRGAGHQASLHHSLSRSVETISNRGITAALGTMTSADCELNATVFCFHSTRCFVSNY